MQIIDFFIQPAYAQASEQPGFESLIPIVLLFIVFYFLLIRPQQKKNKAHKLLIAELKAGQEVSTFSGLVGTLLEVGDVYAAIKISEHVNVQIEKSSVAKVLPKGSINMGDLATMEKLAAKKKTTKSAKTTAKSK